MPTIAPAGKASKVTVLLVRSSTSFANSLSMVTSSAEVGITDWMRIFTGLPCAQAGSGLNASASESSANNFSSDLTMSDLLLGVGEMKALAARLSGPCPRGQVAAQHAR